MDLQADLEGRRARALTLFLALAHAALSLNMARVLPGAARGPLAWLFGFAAVVVQSAALLVPAAMAALLLSLPAARRRSGGFAPHVAAVLLAGAAQLVLSVDITVHRMFGFHLNGFVWNIVSTPGGIESLGASEGTSWLVALLGLSLVGLNALLLALAWRLAGRPASRWSGRRGVAVALGALVVLAGGQAVAHAAADARHERAVLEVAHAVPWYVGVTAKHLARRLGLRPVEAPRGPRLGEQDGGLLYPRRPLTLAPDRRRLNVVWLVSESLRADMVDPTIMPATHAFARRATWFRNHLSGGNGTRMGMFTMFYGLYGSYWFRCLEERRGPVLLDTLLRDGYRVQACSSNSFSYPEFDQTVFAALPRERLVNATPGQETWQRDRELVGRLCDFIDEGPPDRPLFAFMFFESPHARYFFPPESVVREDYLPTLNYATMNVERDIGRIKARYENACHHLDQQLGRVLEHLERRGLLDSTLVVITGDHGEEFMEHGRWGHNSAFSHEQTSPPLILWAPGRAPAERTDLTSHLDIPVTVLKALGVTNPPEDFAQGIDLLGPARREWAVLADWSTVVYADEHDRVVCPLAARLDESLVMHDEVVLDDPTPVLVRRRDRLLELARGLRAFCR